LILRTTIYILFAHFVHLDATGNSLNRTEQETVIKKRYFRLHPIILSSAYLNDVSLFMFIVNTCLVDRKLTCRHMSFRRPYYTQNDLISCLLFSYIFILFCRVLYFCASAEIIIYRLHFVVLPYKTDNETWMYVCV